MAVMALTVLGVVYGDIGTSPLYALKETFLGPHSPGVDEAGVLGVLSLVTWALILVVSVKYVTLVLRADSQGEGGILILSSLLQSAGPEGKGRRTGVLMAIGLFGAALLFGDGAITPAISVLSAIEGLEEFAPSLDRVVLPVAILVLLLLFGFQRRGTAGVGMLFGPIAATWFLIIAALGFGGILRAPEVLAAINPLHGVRFLAEHGVRGGLVLGTVFLAVTGAEALYADLGHFGPGPIRLAWYTLVLPALLLNYYGQGGALLANPGLQNPFYALVPRAFLLPVVAVATVATVIASQAVVTGVFSLSHQAIQLGYLPRMRIIHTSRTERGQTYCPTVNSILMLMTVGLALGFQSSSRLAAAYGVAVAMTMGITTILFACVAVRVLGWRRYAAAAFAVVFGAMDAAFIAANLSKILHGAWFPLVAGLVVFTVFTTWARGVRIVAERREARGQDMESFLRSLGSQPPLRVPGRAIYMARTPTGVPPALQRNLRHNKVLHSQVGLLTIVFEDSPRAEGERVTVRGLGHGLYRIIARYGFAEVPDVRRILREASRQGVLFPLRQTSFFLGREVVVALGTTGMPVWQERLFAFMLHNALDATTYFNLPPAQVVELNCRIVI